jgi:hypothetical protein
VDRLGDVTHKTEWARRGAERGAMVSGLNNVSDNKPGELRPKSSKEAGSVEKANCNWSNVPEIHRILRGTAQIS